MECAGVAEGGEPVVRSVKLLGEESRNGRRYLPESVSPSQYEGKPVNLNHPEGPNKQRIVQERFGWIENARKEGDEWKGDLRYNPKHPFAEQFAWFAANKPDQIGLSHDAIGTGRNENGKFIVQKVVEVKSVDLVADPASTKGLFESMDNASLADGGAGVKDEGNELHKHLHDAIKTIAEDDEMEVGDQMKKIRALLKLKEKPESVEREEESEEEGDEAEKEDGQDDKDEEEGDEAEKEDGQDDEDEEDEMSKAEESLKQLASKYPGVKKLFERVDAAETKLAVREKNDLAHRLCREANLPSVAVTSTFLGQLLEARDEKAMKALIEDRKAIVSIQKPRSTGPTGGNSGQQITNQQFAESLRGGR